MAFSFAAFVLIRAVTFAPVYFSPQCRGARFSVRVRLTGPDLYSGSDRLVFYKRRAVYAFTSDSLLFAVAIPTLTAAFTLSLSRHCLC